MKEPLKPAWQNHLKTTASGQRMLAALHLQWGFDWKYHAPVYHDKQWQTIPWFIIIVFPSSFPMKHRACVGANTYRPYFPMIFVHPKPIHSFAKSKWRGSLTATAFHRPTAGAKMAIFDGWPGSSMVICYGDGPCGYMTNVCYWLVWGPPPQTIWVYWKTIAIFGAPPQQFLG